MASEHSGFFQRAGKILCLAVLSSSFKQMCLKVHIDLNEALESTCLVKEICVWHY